MELQLRGNQRVSGRQITTSVSPSRFVQQGTVDWPSLANASINASVSLLTRLSGCGVELWTMAVAQVILGNIRLSAEGESRINEALTKLHSFGSYGNAIYFGFGVKHVIRTLADSSEGMATLAVCASIAEIHGPAISTQIISEYAKLYSGPTDPSLMPSIRQWEALVSSCAGALSRSPFGSVVEFFMRFHPETHLCGDPKQVAGALEGLAKISNGLMKSMVLIGNAECGFLAANAHWLLGLRVVIQSAAGRIVYPSSGANIEDHQLMVIYSRDQGTSKTISRTADAYYIDDIMEILPDIEGSDYLSGRVEWGTAIGQTFGSSAMKLLQLPSILGEIIGSAAKVYTIAGESVKPNMPLLSLTRFGPEVAGRAFVDLALRQLPGLSASKDAMKSAVERSCEDAWLQFEKAISILKEVCGCSMNCSPQTAGPVFFDITEQGSNNRLDKTIYDVSSCLPVLALTIIQLVRQLSTVASIPADLCPKRRGLEALYEKVKTKFSGLQDMSKVHITLLDALDSLGLLNLAALIFGVELPFASREGYRQDRNLVSVWVNGGLCLVMDSVIRLSSRAEESLRVHILPGHIEWHGRLYNSVRDGSIGAPHFLMRPMILPVQSTEYRDQLQLLDGMRARAVITESFDCVRMSYEIKTASGTFSLGPGQLSQAFAKAVSGISCLGKRCRPLTGLHENFLFTLYSLRLPYDGYRNQKVPFDIPEKPNIILLGENEIARCTALVGDSSGCRIILQERECISCCARRALMADKPHEIAIISHLTVEDVEHMLGQGTSLVLGA